MEQPRAGTQRVNITGVTEGMVQEMFSTIAHAYDINNTLLSCGLHYRWKRAAVKLAGVSPGERALDVGAGTADLTLLLAHEVGETGGVVALDLNERMLVLGRRKIARRGLSSRISFVRGNAEDLVFSDNSFDAVTIGFTLRNIVDIHKALREIWRVLRPGRKGVCLEFSRPSSPLLRRLYDFYSFTLLPRIGTIVSGDTTGVYRYLTESIRKFPDQEDLREIMHKAGFSRVTYTNLSGGIVAVHVGIK